MSVKLTVSEIKALLAGRVEEFCHTFLPNGRREGSMWVVGDLAGSPGDSVKIHLTGDRQGLVYENGAGSDRGGHSLIDVYLAVKGLTQGQFAKALDELKGWLRVPETGGLLERRTLPRPGGSEFGEKRPDRVSPKGTPVAQGGLAWEYLVEKRGICPEVIARYGLHEGLVWMPQAQSAGVLQGGRPELPSVIYPVLTADGKAWHGWKAKTVRKYWLYGPLKGQAEESWRESYPTHAEALERALADAPEGTGPKDVIRRFTCSNKGFNYHLIGMAACSGRRVVIAEGEEDMLSWASAGVEAVSVPMGAKADAPDRPNSGNQWIENDWDWLCDKEELVVAMDEDEVGRAARATLLKRLGTERCLYVEWPGEGDDANSVWLADPEELPRVLARARAVDPEELRRAREFGEAIWNEFFPTDEREPGVELSFPLPFRIRPGEVTVWTGYNKSGKTVFITNQLVKWAGKDGQRCCVASLEMPAHLTLRNAMRQALNRPKPGKIGIGPGGVARWEPDRDLFNRALDWLNEHFFIFHKLGEVPPADVLRVFKHAARRYGVHHFVLDSLMKTTVHEDDLQGQKELMNALFAFAREYGVHVHIVCHARKGSEKRPDDKYPPRKQDIKGSGAISDVADNVIAVFRWREKEAKLHNLWQVHDQMDPRDFAGRDATLAEIKQADMGPDTRISVLAQRHGNGEEPVRDLWFWGGPHGGWTWHPTYEDLQHVKAYPDRAERVVE